VQDVPGFTTVRARGAVGWIAPELAAGGLAAFWAALLPLPGAKGRGGIGVLQLDGRELVVRPYRRGGALGSLLRDRYAGPRRARDELAVLQALRQEGVPVVVPVAAVARRHHAFWRLRLCTERIADALPVPAFLAAAPALRRAAAEAVGIVVRLAFAAGLHHPDLHLDNVLCAARGDRVRAVLVDLDRAQLRLPLRPTDRDAMLVRLARHLVRHRARLPALPSRGETMRFLAAIEPECAARHALWRRLAEATDKDLRRRGWLRRAPRRVTGRGEPPAASGAPLPS
jgi:3-deoxy-D-manno-octulosonic acid kinase